MAPICTTTTPRATKCGQEHGAHCVCTRTALHVSRHACANAYTQEATAPVHASAQTLMPPMYERTTIC
eukprot:11185966-Lingulodinium_polyedra.AAC.1